MKGRVVIVGSSSGLGYHIAKHYIDQGWQVGVASRRMEPLRELQRLAPERVFVETLDVTDPDAESRLLSLVECVGGMDIYIHSSGIGFQNRELEPQIEISTLRTNGEGFVRMVTSAFNYFKSKGGGQLVAISSVAATRGIANAPAYSAVKGMQGQYLDALAQLSTTERLNIKISDIRPGFVATPLLGEKSPFPMTMGVEYATKRIVSAISARRRRAIIDWRYSILVAFWRMIPRCLWERIRL